MFPTFLHVYTSLEHENILQILGYFHDHASVFLVLEEASGGEFYRNKIAKAKRKRLKENVAANYIHQVVGFNRVYLFNDHFYHLFYNFRFFILLGVRSLLSAK